MVDYYVQKEGMPKYKHGQCRSKEYWAWQDMKQRCFNPRNAFFKDYGARGIAVHSEWVHSFEAFVNYVGFAPTTRHSIERIDNDGDYRPGNVKWALPKEQASNRRMMKLMVGDQGRMRMFRRNGFSARYVAAKFGVSTAHVHRLCGGLHA